MSITKASAGAAARKCLAPDHAALPELSATIADLSDLFGDQTYESLARKSETMTTGATATYAYDQIDQARAEATTAIWRTLLTSDDTILTWMAVVATR